MSQKNISLQPGVSSVPLPQLTDTKRVIIDTDPGNDDAIALLMLLNTPSISVEAITIAPGNVDYDSEVHNALYITELAGKSGKVSIHPGARKPLLDRPYPTSSFIHGKSGLGDFDPPAVEQKPDPEHAIDTIRRLVKKYPNEIVIVALGALTNIALALLREPEIAPLIKGIYFTGGPLDGLTGVATFNAMADPEAVSIVIRSGAYVAMIGGTTLLTDSLLYREDFETIAGLKTPFSEFFMKTNSKRLQFEMEHRHAKGSVNGDPLIAALVMDPSIDLEHISVAMRVELEGQFTRGWLIYGENRYNGQPTAPPNVYLCTKASNVKFRELLIKALSQLP